MNKRFSLIDKYVAVEVLKPFFGAIILFLFLLLMFQTLRLADFVIVHQVPGRIVLQLAVFLLVSISAYTFPIAYLASVIIAFGRLSSESELTAFRASGISYVRLTRPALAVAALCSMISLLVTQELGPLGERSFNELLAKMSRTQVASALREGAFNSGFYDLLLFAEKIDAERGRMSRVFIYDEREKNFPLVVVARDGAIQSLLSQTSLGGQILLKLFNGHTYQLDPVQKTSQVGAFREYELFLKIEEATGIHMSEPRVLPFGELRAHIAGTPKNTPRYNDLQAEFWKRIGLSISPFVFCLLGIGLGVVRTRAVQSRGVILTLVTVAIYWQSLVYASSAVVEGRWGAAIGMQFPNALVAIAAIFFYRRVIKS